MSYWNAVLNYFVANPPIVAALIASLVAIVVGGLTFNGVRMTIRATAEKTRLELQHSVEQEHRNREHSRSEAEKERELSAKKDRHARLTAMRREIYIDAVAQMTSFQTVLGELPSMVGDQSKARNQAHLLSVAVQRVTVVGEFATVAAVRRVQNDYMKLFSQCTQRAAPIWTLLRRKGEIEPAIAQAISRQDASVEEMRQLNLRGEQGADVFRRLNDQHSLAQREADEHRQLLDRLHQEIAEHQISYLQFFADAMRNGVQRVQRDLLVSIRAELELHSDAALFDALQEEMLDAVGEVIESWGSFARRK